MNIFSYFRNIPLKERDIPSKNIPLYKWSVYQVKKAMVPKEEIQKLVSFIYETLQKDEDLDIQGYKRELLEQLLPYKKDWLKRYLSDFPLILFLFIFLFHHVYQGIIVQMLEFQSIQWDIPIGWGLVLRIVGTYVLIKILLNIFSRDPKRSTIWFWLFLSISFIAYLMIQYYSTQLDGSPWFMCPLWIWGLLCSILLGLSLIVVKREQG